MSELTIQPSAKDTRLNQAVPTGNYGSLTYIDVRVFSVAVPDRAQRDLLEFDISELPAGQNLISATLYLYYYAYDEQDPDGLTIWAYKLTRADWVELQATWNIFKTANNWTVPGGDYVTSNPAGGSTVFPASYGWMSFNVLAIVQDAYDGEIAVELLVRFDDEGPSAAYGASRFYSKDETVELTLRPKLVIVHEPLLVPSIMGRKTAHDGYRCFMEQYVRNRVEGLSPLKLPDGTLW